MSYQSSIKDVDTLILSSGALYGICYVGCLQYIEECNMLSQITTVIGCSAGAIVGSLLYFDFSSQEILYLITHVDFTNFQNQTLETMELEDMLHVFDKFGLDDGSKFLETIDICFEKKTGIKNITFQQAYELTQKEFQVSASCLNTCQCEMFSYITHPDMPIKQAIQISCAIPLVYQAVPYQQKLYVDGALSNIINLTKSHKKRSLGILLSEYSHESPETTITNIGTYFMKLYKTTINQIENLIRENYKNCIIIDVSQTQYARHSDVTKFVIHNDDALELVNLGYHSIRKYYHKKPYQKIMRSLRSFFRNKRRRKKKTQKKTKTMI